MSANGNQWKPNKPWEETCPSGQKVWVKMPGPEFTLKAGRIGRTFSAKLTQEDKREGETDAEYNQRLFESMSDDELETSFAYGRILLVAMCISPKLYLNPNADKDQIGPDDLPADDFWHLVNVYSRRNKGGVVKVADTEVEAESLETFRDESGIPGSGVDGVCLPVTEPERATTDQGLGSGAGA